MRRIRKALENQAGQTMLIVVLAIVIALTVVLSVASRSIINVKTTTEEANSQKALAAAEAGIERMLQNLTSGTSSISGEFGLESTTKSKYSTTITSLAGRNLVLNGGNLVKKDEGIDLWFIQHNSDGTPDYTSPTWTGTMDIYWGELGDNCQQNQLTNTMAALEIVVIEGTVANPLLRKYVYDPCGDRSSQNNFQSAENGGTVSGKEFSHSKRNISINQGIVAKIVPLYANAPVAVVASVDLPSQGSVISSIGSSGSTERRINVFQGYPSLPTEYFPNNFFYYNL